MQGPVQGTNGRKASNLFVSGSYNVAPVTQLSSHQHVLDEMNMNWRRDEGICEEKEKTRVAIVRRKFPYSVIAHEYDFAAPLLSSISEWGIPVRMNLDERDSSPSVPIWPKASYNPFGELRVLYKE
uniref:Uncharacterized protein n=1 Tax=Pristionchus pacificus TaxID=54126 RepID=A0A2A6D103_PRIPA|eukprot:PDM84050.1 hypothetical protein PRIPAC_34242 [Pristionchus pacificus]